MVYSLISIGAFCGRLYTPFTTLNRKLRLKNSLLISIGAFCGRLYTPFTTLNRKRRLKIAFFWNVVYGEQGPIS